MIPTARRAFACFCGQPVFFGNSRCLACGRDLGYDAQAVEVRAIEPDPQTGGLWRRAGSGAALRYRRCANFATAAACDWLLAVGRDDGTHGAQTLCRACRLSRTIPDLSNVQHQLWWARVEQAKRRLVSSLIALGLPVASRIDEDIERGLAFDLLRPEPGSAVTTGHADGIVTLNIEEADDARRERERVDLAEPYRTVLGHLRHEVGHYYWQRLVDGGAWHEPFRERFGDERSDYAAALARHHQDGPPADWQDRHVSAYASCHPWEDWAETWAHYLHMVDTIDTALSYGIDADQVSLQYQTFGDDALHRNDPGGAAFLRFIKGWNELTGVLNELSRSMGLPDFYPFVLSATAVAKLHLVHLVVAAATTTASAAASSAAREPAPDSRAAAGPGSPAARRRAPAVAPGRGPASGSDPG